MFTKDFERTVYQGDYIVCDVEGFRAFATLYVDDDTTPPDKRMDGFWPSLDPKDPGYIGPKSKSTLARQRKHMQHVYDSWCRDEWHYFGVAVTVWKNDIQLIGDYDHACWGIEGNWPSRRKNKNTNAYFRQVANELIVGALESARSKIKMLCAA